MKKLTWVKNEGAGNYVLNNGENKVFLSYQPNNFFACGLSVKSDSSTSETAIVLEKDKDVSDNSYMKKTYPDGKANRYLIFEGDKRKELEKLYPDIKKLKEYWKKYGGHFWSDSLEE